MKKVLAGLIERLMRIIDSCSSLREAGGGAC